MGTLGYSATGDSYNSIYANEKIAHRFTLADTLVVASGHVRLHSTQPAAPAGRARLIIYGISSGEPGAIVAQSDETVGIAAGAGILDFTFPAPVTLAAGDYYLAVHGGTQVDYRRLFISDANATQRWIADTYADGPTNPWGSGTTNSEWWQPAIWVESAIEPPPDPGNKCGRFAAGDSSDWMATPRIWVSPFVAPHTFAASAGHALIAEAVDLGGTRFVVYENQGGVPGARIARSNPSTDHVAGGTWADFTFPTPVMLTEGVTYWLGLTSGNVIVLSVQPGGNDRYNWPVDEAGEDPFPAAGTFYTSYGVELAVYVDSGLVLAGITPNAGSTIGGTAVTISGSGFTDATGATVGGVALTSFVVVNDATITGVTGAHAAGAVDVVVTVGAETATLAGGYTYVDSLAISPSHGPASGGTAVTLTANGWFAPGAVVTVGGGTVAAVVQSASAITFAAPAHSAGLVVVAVTSQGVTRSATFTYDLVVTPNSGPDTGGTTVRITGVAAGTPAFGGSGAASVSSGDWNSILCVTPAHAPGVVGVVVGGLTAANAFTYLSTVPEVDASGCAPILTLGTVTSCVGLGELSNLEIGVGAGEDLLLLGMRMPLAVAAGVLRGAEILVERAYMADRGGPVVGTYHVFEGRVEADASSTALRLSIESHASALKNVLIPRTPIQEKCANQLCDAACGLDPAALTVSAVAQVSGYRTSVATSTVAVLGAAAGRFINGVLIVTSGACNGERRTIALDFAYGGLRAFNLSTPLPAMVQTGDTFTVFPDCAKTPAACYAFGNLDRFRGFPFLPQESPTGQSIAPTTLHYSMHFLAWGETILRATASVSGNWDGGVGLPLTIPLAGVPLVTDNFAVELFAGETMVALNQGEHYAISGASVVVSSLPFTTSGTITVTYDYDAVRQGIEIDTALYGSVDLGQWGWAEYGILPGLAADEKVTISGVDFVAAAPGSPPAVNRWNVGATEAESAASLANAVNSSSSAGVKDVVFAQAVGASVVLVTKTTAVTVTRSGAHISPPPYTDIQPMFTAGAAVNLAAGPWTDAHGVPQNLDGLYTVEVVAPNRIAFVAPASVRPGWASAALPSPFLPMTLQRVTP